MIPLNPYMARAAGVLVLAFGALTVGACGLISGDSVIDEGVVIAPTLKIRSSTAMVALDLAVVSRGDRVEILDQTEVKTPTRTEEWYKVRTKDRKPTVGWVEARYVVNGSVVDKINELYERSRETPAQGIGRLKVRTRLRIEPGGDVITFLSRSTPVEIVRKARSPIKAGRQDFDTGTEESSEEPELPVVTWYEVRLPETEVLRAGWVGAQQVELDVPDEILHLEGEGRRFTGWIVFDQVKDRKGEIKNNYIGLMRSYGGDSSIDFSRIWVLNYSPALGRYEGAYIGSGLRGVLPVSLGISSGRSGFTIYELDENDRPVPIEYEVIRSGLKLNVTRLSPKLPPRRSAGRR